MELQKADAISTSVSTQAPYEPDAQGMLFLAEKTHSEDQRVLLAALDVLERSGTDVSQVPTNREEAIQRIHHIPPEQHEPGLERLLTYFCPQSLGSVRIGVFESLNDDLLTKVVPNILEVLGSSTNISDDEKKNLCNHSPEAIVGNPTLLRQVLQAAYDLSLVSIVARGIEEPQPSLPDLQTAPTLAEKTRITRAWLETNGPSAKEISLTRTEDLYVTCLPEEICALTNLSRLSIDDQRIRTLPHSIGKLSNLTYLSLDGNRITTVPQEIGNLSNLQQFDLSHNQLTTLPKEIGNLSNLQELFLSLNQITTLPQEVGKLKSLIHLFLDHNQIATLPKEIWDLSSLFNLYLCSNQITILPQELWKFSSPLNLYLDNNQITTLPKKIRALIYLSLRNNPLTDQSLQLLLRLRGHPNYSL